MEPVDRLAEATAGKTELRDVNVRQVSEGFILSGNRRWADANGIVDFSMTYEAVASSAASAVLRVEAFINTGNFTVVA